MKNKDKLIIRLFLILIILMVALLNISNSQAASFTVSKSNVSLEIGKTSTITINASIHTGRIDVVSSNPGVVTVSGSSFWVENNSQTFTISAKSEGSATITIKGEVFDSSIEEEKEYEKTINVSVIKPVVQEQPKQETNGGSSSNAGGTSGGSSSNAGGTSAGASQNTGGTSSKTSGTASKSSSNSSNSKKSNNTGAKTSTPLQPTTQPVQDINTNVDAVAINEPANEEPIQNVKETETQIKEDVIEENETKVEEVDENVNDEENNLIFYKHIIIPAIAFISVIIIAIGIIVSKKLLKK